MKSPAWPNIKWAILLVLPVLLLLFFCGYGCVPKEEAEAYERAEAFYLRYVTDTAETLNYPYDEQLARNWCTYARYPVAGDLGPHNLPDELYDYPLNMGVYYQEDGVDKSLNNADTLAELGEDGIQEVMNYAVAHWNRLWSVDYRAMDKETYRMALLWYYSPYIKTRDYHSDWVDAMYDYHCIVTSAFVADPSAIYKAADGSFRVRGIGYIQYHSVDNADYIDGTTDVSVGATFYCIIEIGMIPYTDDGRSPQWIHGPYHICMYCRFSEWRPSDNDEINKQLAILPSA